MTYAATGLLPRLAIGKTTGVIAGMPTAVGAYTVTLTVTDTAASAASVSFGR